MPLRSVVEYYSCTAEVQCAIVREFASPKYSTELNMVKFINSLRVQLFYYPDKTEYMAPFSKLLIMMHSGCKCTWCAMHASYTVPAWRMSARTTIVVHHTKWNNQNLPTRKESLKLTEKIMTPFLFKSLLSSPIGSICKKHIHFKWKEKMSPAACPLGVMLLPPIETWKFVSYRDVAFSCGDHHHLMVKLIGVSFWEGYRLMWSEYCPMWRWQLPHVE
jgi:hypothetical protein